MDRQDVAAAFRSFREQLIATLEGIERELGSDACFERKAWDRPGGGGGEMGLLHGQVFEKAGVNYSLVEVSFQLSLLRQFLVPKTIVVFGQVE